MFPVLLNLKNRLVVVVGGGRVGRRKAAAALAAGARVRLVCLEPHPPEEIAPALSWLTAAYEAAHLDSATLVFAAGPAALNRIVVADAQARGLWVNSATAPDAGDFTLPATVRQGEFVIAIGTGGAAPALARRLRQELEKQFDPAYGAWVALLAEIRPLLLAACTDEGERRRRFERWCQADWLERLRAEGVDAVRAAWRGEIFG